jgi:hypothetical protein
MDLLVKYRTIDYYMGVYRSSLPPGTNHSNSFDPEGANGQKH